MIVPTSTQEQAGKRRRAGNPTLHEAWEVIEKLNYDPEKIPRLCPIHNKLSLLSN